MSASLQQGRIVWIELLDPQGQNPKVRPAVILTSSTDIKPDGEIVVAAMSSQIDQSPPAVSVEVPWHRDGHPRTKLNRRNVVVCSWLVTLPVSSIASNALGGLVPFQQMVRILEIVRNLQEHQTTTARNKTQSMKQFDVIGLGNSLVDILIELTDEEFADLHFEKGTMRLVESHEQKILLELFKDHEPRLVSGGSVANSIIACSQLCGHCAFIGCVGDDRYGLHYATEFAELKIDFTNLPIVGETTGTCVSIITPDAERTMRTSLAVSSHLAARHVSAGKIAAAKWLFVEGYLFANPHTGQHAIREAIRIAKANNVKIALTSSDAFIPQVFGDAFRDALKQSDLLFCNATEAMSVAGGTTAAEAFGLLKGIVPNCVVTDGPNGAFVRFQGSECHVPAFPCQPIDATGAGDMFAGAFLYGITHDVPAAQAARAGNYLAMKVITQIGARLHYGAKQCWEECLQLKD